MEKTGLTAQLATVSLAFVRFAAVASIGYFVAFFMALPYPERRDLLFVGANAVLSANIAWVYRERRLAAGK